jgi:hypothetical protein
LFFSFESCTRNFSFEILLSNTYIYWDMGQSFIIEYYSKWLTHASLRYKIKFPWLSVTSISSKWLTHASLRYKIKFPWLSVTSISCRAERIWLSSRYFGLLWREELAFYIFVTACLGVLCDTNHHLEFNYLSLISWRDQMVGYWQIRSLMFGWKCESGRYFPRWLSFDNLYPLNQ